MAGRGGSQMGVHLVTGGSGFLGGLIVDRLVAAGEQVRIIDVWDSADRPAEAEFANVDVRDREAVAKAMQGVKVVHHNAALVPLTKSGKDFASVNETGSQVVAEEAVRAGAETFIHMSSSAVFGLPDSKLAADDEPRPTEIYGKSKLAGEVAVREVCGKAGMPVIIIRPRTILAHRRLGIYGILFRWIAEGRRIYIIGDGSNAMQFIHADDLMDCYFLAMARGQEGNFNVGAPEYGTLRSDLEDLIKHAGSSSRVVGLPVGLTVTTLGLLDMLRLSPLAPWHYRTYHLPFHFDVDPLLKMGWQPRHSNISMLEDAYDWYIANRDDQDKRGPSLHRRDLREGVIGLLRRLS